MNGAQSGSDFPAPQPLEILTADDLFARLDQQLLLALREDRRIEFKRAQIRTDTLAEYVCMWANTSPEGGILLLGVEDDGRLSGCGTLTQAALNRLESPSDLCPGARCDVKRVPINRADGVSDFVIAVRVFYNMRRVVKTPKGAVFARCGDQRKQLRPEEIRELQIDKGEVSYEQESAGLRFPDDFDIEAVHAFAQNVRSMSDLQTEVSDAEILVAKHLAIRDGRGGIDPNIACALLFAKEPDRRIPGCKIRFLRFEGGQERTGEHFNAVKDIWLENLTVPRLIERAEVVLDAQIRTFSALGRDGKFYTAAEYPKAAWYEAVVNACVHRSYGNGLQNMMIFIKMFDDRLEVESPGPFPPMVTSSNLYGLSHPRNPKLMHAMYFMRFVKMAGEGTRRMREKMQAMNLPEPEFSEKQLDSSRVRVTLRNNVHLRREWIDSEAADVVGNSLAATLSDDERRIINFVAENGSINVTQAVRVTELSWETAKKRLINLTDRGLLEHVRREDVDRDPSAHYRLHRQS